MSTKRGILERTVDRLGEVDTGHPEYEFKVKGRDKLHDVIRIGMAWNWGRADQETPHLQRSLLGNNHRARSVSLTETRKFSRGAERGVSKKEQGRSCRTIVRVENGVGTNPNNLTNRVGSIAGSPPPSADPDPDGGAPE